MLNTFYILKYLLAKLMKIEILCASLVIIDSKEQIMEEISPKN